MQTMRIALTTAVFLCNGIGNELDFGTLRSLFGVKVQFWMSAAAPAASSQRCRSGALPSMFCLPKLRYARRFGRALVQGSAVALPFRNDSFPCVLCSRVIEDVPKGSPILDDLERVLASGGRLVLGTPDCAKWEWVTTKKLCDRLAPGAREHISHYSRSELVERFESRGFKLEAVRRILRSELILAFRKL